MATSFLEIFYKTNRFLKRYINIVAKPIWFDNSNT